MAFNCVLWDKVSEGQSNDQPGPQPSEGLVTKVFVQESVSRGLLLESSLAQWILIT